jgi:CSLREA domain-containing protein
VQVGEAGGRSAGALLVAALIALACALVVPVVASAESFEVDSVADETDAAPGNEFCLTAGGKCTLRAAIEEANSLEGEDGISFAREVEEDEEMKGLFDGSAAATISLGSVLPPIVSTVNIFGECVLTVGLRPCVGVDGPGLSEPALVVENAEVEIHGLAITGAETGIEVSGSPRLRISSNWLGVKLDGSAGGNGTGIRLGKGLENARIGNEGETNVFANNLGDGLDIHGSDKVSVMGGYFGVAPDGVTLAPNGGKDIEVVAFAGSGGVGNRIGTLLTSLPAATPACDGGCNVISGAGSSGIDLEGDGGEESPATDTTIIGNHIGLDLSGTAAVPNAGDGIHVGRAARTVIGGPRGSEGNRFAGGEAAVEAGPEAANLVIRGNSIGVAVTGAGLAAPDGGILVNSEGLPSAAAEAVIAGNEIRMQGGVAIDQKGLGGWIDRNRIAGAGIGIRTSGYEEHGNLIEGNLIERSGSNAILIENELNEVLGNEIAGAGGAGIRLLGVDPFRTFGNRVGGDTEADENRISGSGAAAIEIANIEKNSANEVARNRGGGNGGMFIDLVALSPGTEPKGPNEGIAPPPIEAVTWSEARGSAEPGARVRVFRKAGTSAGEIASFLGEAIVDEEGLWAVAYAAVPAGTAIAATQTDGGGGTSELAFATTPADPIPVCALPAGCGPLVQPVPQTKIFKGPKGKKSVKGIAAFKFKSSVSGSSFQCRLDGGPFKRCHSPQVYSGLKSGRHRFEVRATAAGQVDASPAKQKFTVLAAH